MLSKNIKSQGKQAIKMLAEMKILKRVVELLSANEIDYYITGGLAMSYYGYPRMTRDIDIVVSAEINKEKRLKNLWGDEFYFSPEIIERALQERGSFNIIHKEEVIKIDIFISPGDEFEKAVFDRHKMVKLNNFAARLISLEDLLLKKFLWAEKSNSARQIEDVKNLIKVNRHYDRNYIHLWLKKWGLEDKWKTLMSGY